MSNDNVLIVGAGPTGLMLANQLARRGVRFEIIDRSHQRTAERQRQRQGPRSVSERP